MVVGSGPAGLEAARIARLRGHDVTIWERDGELGGKLEVASLAPSKHEVLRYRTHQRRVLADLGVDVHLGATVDTGVVAARAAGRAAARHGRRPAGPADSRRSMRRTCTTPSGCCAARSRSRPGSVWWWSVAAPPAARPRNCWPPPASRSRSWRCDGRIGAGIEAITRRTLVRGLRNAGVEILTKATVVGIGPDAVTWTDPDGTAHETPADLVALAIGWRPTGGFAVPDGVEVRVVGDAETPADFVRAVNEGADAGLAV